MTSESPLSASLRSLMIVLLLTFLRKSLLIFLKSLMVYNFWSKLYLVKENTALHLDKTDRAECHYHNCNNYKNKVKFVIFLVFATFIQ